MVRPCHGGQGRDSWGQGRESWGKVGRVGKDGTRSTKGRSKTGRLLCGQDAGHCPYEKGYYYIRIMSLGTCIFLTCFLFQKTLTG